VYSVMLLSWITCGQGARLAWLPPLQGMCSRQQLCHESLRPIVIMVIKIIYIGKRCSKYR
jgi:hypothetical protein